MFKLTDDQENACDFAMDWLSDRTSKYLVIQGSAGTGKSTLVENLLKRIRLKEDLLATILGGTDGIHKWEIDMVATTNKACGVLSEMSGREVRTGHSYLKLVPRNNWDTGEVSFIRGSDFERVYNKLLIIDEYSFTSDELYALMDDATVKCKIICVGDQFQLIPVPPKPKPGEVAVKPVPVMVALDCPKVELNQVVRHNSDIAQLSAQCKEMVKTGKFTWMTANGTDILYVDGATCMDMVNYVFSQPDYSMDAARIVTWTNKQVVIYNNHIRALRGMTGYVEVDEELVTNKVIRSKNITVASTDTRVRISEVGEEMSLRGIAGVKVKLAGIGPHLFLPYDQAAVTKLKNKLKRDGEMQAFFTVRDEWLDLRPVFASTVHKSQGSSFDNVFVNLHDIGRCPVADEVARMLYVAISRASKRVILFGKLPPKYGGVFNAITQRAA